MKKLPKDSFGNQLKEGDTIEYYNWCYCHAGSQVLSGDELTEQNIESLKKGGYTAERRFDNIYVGKCLQLSKPLHGKIKWNEEFLTYEPLVFSEDDFNGNSALYVCRKDDDGSYIKKIQ